MYTLLVVQRYTLVPLNELREHSWLLRVHLNVKSVYKPQQLREHSWSLRVHTSTAKGNPWLTRYMYLVGHQGTCTNGGPTTLTVVLA
jgi:hypothetical protein